MSRSRITEDLLAEVKAAAADDAAHEAARLVAVQAAREAEVAQRQAAEQARAEAETRARVEAETRRRTLVEAHRERLLNPVAEPVAAAARTPIAEAPTPADLVAPGAPGRLSRSSGFWFVVVSLPALCVTAVALAWVFANQPSAAPFQAPAAAPIPEVASGPEPQVAVEVMPVAHVLTEPTAVEVDPVMVPTVASTRPRRPTVRPIARPVAPASTGLELGNLLETDDTRPRR